VASKVAAGALVLGAEVLGSEVLGALVEGVSVFPAHPAIRLKARREESASATAFFM
jgi:hypothetical protein